MAASLAGCATGAGKLRNERDDELKDGDFLAALDHSRALYRSDAPLSDLAAHCGLVFAVSHYTEARECVDRLLERIAASEASFEADLQHSLAEAAAKRNPRQPLPEQLRRAYQAKVFGKGQLVPGWRNTRYGVEAILVLHNLKWRALYVRGMTELQTGDPAAAKAALSEAREIVLKSWNTPEGSLTLADFLEERQDWEYQKVRGAGSDDSRAWWIDLLGALAVASSASGDAEGAAAAKVDLQVIDPPRRLRGYKQSRLAFAYLAAGEVSLAKIAADADPEQSRRKLRVGGGVLSGGLLLAGLLAASAVASAPATTIGAAIANAAYAALYTFLGVTTSVLTLTVSRVAGQDTAWDLTQRWYAVARISRAVGDDEKADAMYRKLLKNEEVLQSQPGIQWQVYADVAEQHELAGRADEAIAFYQKAVTVIEATRRNIASESAKIGFVADKQRVYQRLMRLLLKRGLTRTAFELSEQARARALLDVLASRDWTVASDGGLAQQGELIRQIEAQESETRLAILQDSPKEEGRRRSALRDLIDRVQTQDPQLAALTYVKRYSVEEIQRSLLPGEVLLSFMPAGDHLVAFALSRTELHHWMVPSGQISGHVGLLRHALEQHSVTPGVTRALAELLFSGLRDMSAFDKLTLVPTGVLHALPFAALQAEDGVLSASVSIRLLPSASVLPLLGSRPQQQTAMTITAFGNPDFGGLLPALPSTEDEARDVAAIVGFGRALTGRNASKANALRHSGDSSVLHFATHGQFDPKRPLQSALYLSDGRGGTEALTASDFYGMRIGARLVTLSACETGLGSVKSGDEVIGLYRGLMFAGASTIVASLWEVDDESTSFLMTRFYTHLKTHAAAEALRLAQRDTAARWADPYHWAGFAVIGLDDPFGPSPGVSPLSSAAAHAR